MDDQKVRVKLISSLEKVLPNQEPTMVETNGSVRLESINEVFQDYRAMKLLESFVGKEKTMELLSDWGLDGYQEYPRCGESHKAFREKNNALIKKRVANGKERAN